MEGINTTHKSGDYVVYKNNGICFIKEIKREDFGRFGENTYYVMQSVYDSNTVVYLPVDSFLVSEMKHVLTAVEINAIIDSNDTLELQWIDDIKRRALVFDDILLDGDRAKFLWVFKELSHYKKELEASKKKMYASDSRILAAVEKVITEEFAFALGIDKKEVVPYIIERIGKNND